MKALIAAAVLFIGLAAATAQSPPGPSSPAPKAAPSAHKPAAAVRAECVLAVGLCVTVPASWKRLGDVFDDLGFVVAEPHPGADPASWPQLTVAAIDVPPPSTGASAPSLDSLVDIVLTPDGSFTSAETLQRTHLLLNHAEAEIVRVQLHEEADKPGAVEAIALIQGDDGLVYSIALRCAPEEFARLEPVFQQAARSWRIKPPAPSPKPRQDSEKK
jgi:hypothetical protein